MKTSTLSAETKNSTKLNDEAKNLSPPGPDPDEEEEYEPDEYGDDESNDDEDEDADDVDTEDYPDEDSDPELSSGDGLGPSPTILGRRQATAIESEELSVFDTEDNIFGLDMEERRRRAEERKAASAANKTINYVDKDELRRQIEDYYNTDVMTDALALNIKKIADRLMTSGRFCNYTYRDEMAEDAFLKAYTAIYKKKFNLNLGFSPFSYITQICFHSAQARIKLEKKEREKTDRYRDEHYEQLKLESANLNQEVSDDDY